jgi:Ca2+-binding RTX toxin-like protein
MNARLDSCSAPQPAPTKGKDSTMAIVQGTNGNDVINLMDGVTNGPDGIYGYDGADEIAGFGGNDVLIGGAGADALSGGFGWDTASYSDSFEGVDVWLDVGWAFDGTAEGDTFHSIENLYGSAFGDYLRGNDIANTLNGWNGDDTLNGGLGADILIGGAGIDTAQYSGPVGVFVSLGLNLGVGGEAAGDTYSGIENISATSHRDVLWGDDGENGIWGHDGNDELKGYGGRDYLLAGAGDDDLYGMDGDDVLSGHTGVDTLVGGAGRDSMTGGSEADTFIWLSIHDTSTLVASADSIGDFNAAEGDLISLSGIDANKIAGGNQDFTFIGTAAFSGAPGELRYYHADGNTYLAMQTGTEADVEGVIRLYGIHMPEASWFVL